MLKLINIMGISQANVGLHAKVLKSCLELRMFQGKKASFQVLGELCWPKFKVPTWRLLRGPQM